MNKTFIVGCVLAVAGLAASITGSLIDGKEFFPVVTAADYIEATPHVEDIADVDTVNLDLSNRSIDIVTADVDTVTVAYYEAEHDQIDVTLTSGELIVASQWESWFSFFSWNWIITNPAVLRVTLTVPENSSLTIEATTSNGTIDADEFVAVSSLDLTTSNGAITIEGIETGSDVELATRNGRVTVSDVALSGTLDIDTSNGRLVLDNIEVPTLSAHTSNGPIEATRITSQDAHLDTSNGNITASFSGSLDDFRINMATSNGSYYLNGTKVSTNAYNTNLTDRIRLETSNGSIHLSFLG
ncbi:MAG: DUF4097 family beta strand repeat-containing protein [Bacilli bacterium]|jgi:DUF4097 and DUF4098 domain-containing protein YvlB